MKDQGVRISIRFNFVLHSVAATFVWLSITLPLSTVIASSLVRSGAIDLMSRFSMSLALLVIASIILGTCASAIAAKVILSPMRKLMAASREIARGNFDVSIDFKGPQEIRDLIDSFNAMARELRNIEIIRGDFVRDVSHEFKTPLQSIRGFAKLLKKDGLDSGKRREYLDIIIRETERLGDLAGNVLLLSKIEGQEILTGAREFSLDEQLRRALLLFETAWTKKGLTVSADLAPCVCAGSEELLFQVWINLIGNAVKFTGEGGRVTVSLRRDGGAVSVTVADTGRGMTDDVLRHAFEKFYQGDSSRHTEGNGLGLALVKRIVELHQGRVDVSSVVGRGTRMTVSLPA